jgi:hypothetical protein
MSNLERSPQETPCGGRVAVSVEPVRELQYGAAVALGGPRAMSVTRMLPNRIRRMVGAWCFVDYYGPDDITASPGMQVPHIRTPACRRSAGSSPARCCTATAWAVTSWSRRAGST